MKKVIGYFTAVAVPGFIAYKLYNHFVIAFTAAAAIWWIHSFHPVFMQYVVLSNSPFIEVFSGSLILTFFLHWFSRTVVSKIFGINKIFSVKISRSIIMYIFILTYVVIMGISIYLLKFIIPNPIGYGLATCLEAVILLMLFAATMDSL